MRGLRGRIDVEQAFAKRGRRGDVAGRAMCVEKFAERGQRAPRQALPFHAAPLVEGRLVEREALQEIAVEVLCGVFKRLGGAVIERRFDTRGIDVHALGR